LSREHELSDSDRSLLDAAADDFHAALSRGPVSDWEPHLSRLHDRLRSSALVEFAIIELGHRWKKGERPTVEDYVGRFPDLGPRDRVSGQLIAEEYLQRLAAGEAKDVTQYERRFPVQFPDIRSKLQGIEADQPKRPVSSHADTQIGPTPETSGGVRTGVASNDYQFVRRLGSGAFGEVWLARTTKTGIEKAIKVLHKAADEEVSRRELRSLELIKNLRHPYLLTTEDYWVSDNRLYVVMELADDTLKGRMKECQSEGQPGIPDDELFVMMCEAAEGLDFLHERNVTHRDVKPDNILLLRGHAKVADFGLARQQEQMIAQMSVFAGSPAYMAPEVWSGDSGPSSDLYSFAVTYIELRQGRLPVKLGPVTEIMFAHLEGKFEFDSFIGDAERAVYRKALAKAPADRYETCTEFMEALGKALGRTFARSSQKRKSGSQSHPKLRPLPPTPSQAVATVSTGRRSSSSDPLPSQAGQRTQTPATTRQSGTFRPIASTLSGGTSTSTRLKPKPPTKKWIPAVVAAVLLMTIAGLVAAVVLNPPGGSTSTVGTPSSPSTTPPSRDGTPATTPPTSTPSTTKLPDAVTPPPGTTGVPGSEIPLARGGKAFEWVTATVGTNTIRFRLIRGGNPGNVRPFYISEEKIPNRVFRDGGAADGDPTAPATGMTAKEAAQFAADKFKSGRLPTPDEWDHAAGYFDQGGRDQLWRTGGVPWVNQAAASPLRKGADVNANDLLDMNGNGREWTCEVLTERGTLPKTASRLTGLFSPDERVILRGKNYTSATGLTRGELRTFRESDPLTQLAGKGSPYTGFRVVLPGP
jgi:serine/threonine protein kinase